MKKDSQKDHRKAVNEGRLGYKHSSLGWIPIDWEAFELGEVTKKIMVGIATESRTSVREIGVPFIRNQNIKSGHFDDQEIIYISKEFDLLNKNKRLKAGDVIIVRTGSNVGQACVVPSKFENAQTFTTLIVRPSEKLDSNYLSLHINSFGIREVERLSAGGGKPNLNAGFLESYRILLPPMSEQRKIESILSVWDSAIAKSNQLIEQLKRRNKGLMQELLTPKKEWHKHRIGDLLKTVKRPVDWNDEELYKLISVRRRSGGAFFREALYGKQILTKQLYSAREGDFLISKMQIVHGASAVVPAELSGMKISGSYISLHSKDENLLDISFFNWLSKTRWFYRMAYISSYGVHIEKMTFDFEDFKRRFIVIPSSVKEQKRIDNILALAKTEVDILEQRLAKLESQKKGLMQKLLTGEFRMSIKESINIF